MPIKSKKYHGKDLSTNDFTNEYKKKIDSLQRLYKYKGSVDTYDDLVLIDNNNTGDVWNVLENSMNYCWSGLEWIQLGTTMDLGEMATKTELKQLVEHKYILKITSDITAGTAVTIPCNYKVGANVLDVYLNGERLILSSDDTGTDGHYCEVGETDSTSNQIKTTSDWSLESGDILEFVVRGEYV